MPYFTNDMYGKNKKLLFGYIYVEDGHQYGRKNEYERAFKDYVYEPVSKEIAEDEELLKIIYQIEENNKSYYDIKKEGNFCDENSYVSGCDEDGVEEYSYYYTFNQEYLNDYFDVYNNKDKIIEEKNNEISQITKKLNIVKDKLKQKNIEKSSYLNTSHNLLKNIKAKTLFDGEIKNFNSTIEMLEKQIANVNDSINDIEKKYNFMCEVIKKQQEFERVWFKDGKYTNINEPLKKIVDEKISKLVQRRIVDVIEKYPRLLNYSYENGVSSLSSGNYPYVRIDIGKEIEKFSDLIYEKGIEGAKEEFKKERTPEFEQKLKQEEKEREKLKKKEEKESQDFSYDDDEYEYE